MSQYRNWIILSCIGALLCGCGSESGADNYYSGAGQSGSLASMTLHNDEIYLLDGEALRQLDTSETLTPTLTDIATVINGAQTLFNYQDQYLMVGTEFGVDALEVTPTGIESVASFSHLQAFDPVVAEQGVAVFTTRDGYSEWSSWSDLVSALDISDIQSVQMLATYPELTEPMGLAMDNGRIYVCDQAAGLLAFQLVDNPEFVAEPAEGVDPGLPKLFEQIELSDAYDCYDVIVTGQRLVLTSASGIRQLRVEGEQLTLLSEIGVQ